MCSGDIGFVLDGSGSVGIENWSIMLEFLALFTEYVMAQYPDSRVGVVTFGNDASVEIDFNTGANLQSFMDAVYNIGYR